MLKNCHVEHAGCSQSYPTLATWWLETKIYCSPASPSPIIKQKLLSEYLA